MKALVGETISWKGLTWKWLIWKWLKWLSNSYNEILFLGEFKLGFLICVFTFLYPNIALSGLLSLLIMSCLLMGLKIENHYLIRSALLYNSLLVGLLIGYLFNLNFLVCVLIVISSGLTFLITYSLSSFLFGFSLPVLSLPFTVMSFLLTLSAPAFSNLPDGTHYFISRQFHWMNFVSPYLLEGFRSLGALFCIPDPIFGALIITMVVLVSPLTAIFLSIGYVLGVAAESHLAISGYQDSANHHTFNYALIFASIAGSFLLPSIRSLVWATLGTLSAVIVSAAGMAFWQGFRIPVMALPFNIVALLVIRTLRTIDPYLLSTAPLTTPEKSLENSRLLWSRHRIGESGLYCPFELECTIQQGFHGDWTHQGNWAHALDFVIQGSDGKTFKNKGVELEDYLIFEQPVLSPVDGQVVSLCSSLPDNPIGKVENQKNWGNYVILRSISGVYVSLAHLKKESIEVRLGQTVAVGQRLALCGNSGYSQEPHLHLQTQWSAEVGAHTHPFHLLNYHVGHQGYFHRTPQSGEKICPWKLNAVLDRLLTFRIGQTLTWNFIDPRMDLRCKRKIIRFEHRLDANSGIPFWTDGEARLFYSRMGTQFYFYGFEGKTGSPLCDFFTAAPRIPITFGRAIEFQDFLPLTLTQPRVSRFLTLLQQLLFSKVESNPAHYRWDPAHYELRGSLSWGGRTKTYCKIDPMTGFAEFSVGDRRYVRLD